MHSERRGLEGLQGVSNCEYSEYSHIIGARMCYQNPYALYWPFGHFTATAIADQPLAVTRRDVL